MKRTLKKGGLLLIEGYTPKQLQYGTGGPKEIQNLYTRQMYEAAFGDVKHPVIAFSVDGDQLAPPPAALHLLNKFRNAPRTHHHLTAAELDQIEAAKRADVAPEDKWSGN